MFKKILIANRGEIAVRVLRTAREMGIATVAVYSEADVGALHAELADEAVSIGAPPPGESYLNIERIIEAAKRTGCEAIHPGYGFLSENPLFAGAVTDAGLVFIGPPAEAMRLLGNKIASRELADQAKVPVTPGAVLDAGGSNSVAETASGIGYPVLIKAAAGGGGKGMRVVHDPKELEPSLEAAMREAGSAFGDSTVFLEKYLARPRHVEFQVFGDLHGNAVHLGERECSIQRRHQKIIEESPSVALTPDLRRRMGEAAVRLVKAAEYVNAGTCEFLLDGENFYFLEVNTRLQVEHPVTEMCTGEDLVAWQLQIAAGEPLPKKQEDIRAAGHAIECRIYAEDPANGFLPSSGKILALEEPHMPGVRIDSGVREGSDVSVYYDPIISKVIAHAPTRERAITKMIRALEEYVLLGVATPIEILRDILSHEVFVRGDLSTHFLDDHMPSWEPSPPLPEQLAAALFAATKAPRAGAAYTENGAEQRQPSPWQTLGEWSIAGGGRP